MVNYQNGKIYRLDCLTTGKVYIGSTTKTTLAMRLTEHVSCYKHRTEGKRLDSFQIIENGNYKISLIELCPCNSKDELSAREGHFIRTIDCVNRYIAGRTQVEWHRENKDKRKNRDKIYYETHKDQISEYYKIHNELNKEQINQRKKEQYTCVCGQVLQHCSKASHERTKRHLKFIS